jgi:hypothetical protein
MIEEIFLLMIIIDSATYAYIDLNKIYKYTWLEFDIIVSTNIRFPKDNILVRKKNRRFY